MDPDGVDVFPIEKMGKNSSHRYVRNYQRNGTFTEVLLDILRTFTVFQDSGRDGGPVCGESQIFDFSGVSEARAL